MAFDIKEAEKIAGTPLVHWDPPTRRLAEMVRDMLEVMMDMQTVLLAVEKSGWDPSHLVVWAGSGLDRLHVPSGTKWKWDGEQERWVCRVSESVQAIVEPAINGEWWWYVSRNRLIPSIGQFSWPSTEHEAMEAALKAAGWKPTSGGG